MNENRLRVLHVHSAIDPIGGGPVVALLGLCRAEARRGLQVSLLATFGEGTDLSAGERLRREGIEVRLLGPGRGLLFSHPQLKQTLREMVAAADVVHVHGLWEDIQHQACRAAMRAGVPFVVRPCGGLDPWSMRHGWLKKRLYMHWRMRKNLDRAAAIHYSTAMECELVSRLRILAPAIVEPNGVDLEEFENLPAKGSFRLRYPQLRDRPYVVFLGRLHPLKGLELLIPAFAKVKDPRAMLVIVGPDEGFLAEARRLAAENRVLDRVIFTGLLRDRERVEALADATLFALPSFHENFGTAVIEALAAGVPVVISDHVYIHADVSAAGAGGVVGLEIHALAAELDRWLGDEPLRMKAGAAARAFALANYDWQRIAERWSKHYKSLRGDANDPRANGPAVSGVPANDLRRESYSTRTS